MIKEKKRKAVCILGMHRSGTSAITRAINLLGVELGDKQDLLPASHENPEGYWEHARIVDIQERMLNVLSSSWDTRIPLPDNWWKTPEIQFLKQELLELVQREFGQYQTWGWKDPRTCLLLPVWHEIFQELNIDVSFVMVIRNPLDVAASLIKRDSFSKEESLGIWTLYTLSAFFWSKNFNRVVVQYDKFLDDWESTLRQVSETLDLPWPQNDNELKREMSTFLQPNLRHSKSAVDETLKDDTIADVVKTAYELCLEADKYPSMLNSKDFTNQISQLFYKYCKQANLIGVHQERFKLQIFWPVDNQYSEVKSIIENGIANGKIHEYLIELPPVINGKLRIDPCNIPGIVEIYSIELINFINSEPVVLQSCSNENNFEQIIPGLNSMGTENQENYSLLSLNGDPQLFLNNAPITTESGKLVLRLIMRIETISNSTLKLLKNHIENAKKLSQEYHKAVQFDSNIRKDLMIKDETIKFLSDESHQKDETINDLKQQSQNKEQFIERINRESALKDENIQHLRNELKNKEEEIFLFRNSHGYKLLTQYYKIRDKLFPYNSGSRRIIKLVFNGTLNFKKLRGIITKSNIRKSLFYFKKGNISSLLARIEQKMLDSIYVPEHFNSPQTSNYLLQVLNEENKMASTVDLGITVDVIVPIYNAFEYTKKCIESVYKNSDINYNLYLINDCSPDKNIYNYLENLSISDKPANLKELIITHNEVNIGFVKSVNKGLSMSTNHVILLNTDTEVPKNWIGRLIEPILSDNNVSSVTPFSNSATTCSFPNFCQDNDLPFGLTVNQIDEAFILYGSNKPITLPSGVGFCMALNRNALNKIGLLDAETFGKGYGEENDWCMRAFRAGFKNVLTPNLFVYHKHGVSFNQHVDKKREDRISENLEKVDQRYPEYLPWVHKFIKEDPIKPVRDILKSAITARKDSNKKGILFINHTLGGGTKLYQDNLIQQIGSKTRIYTLELSSNDLVLQDWNHETKMSFILNLKHLSQSTFNNLLKLWGINLIYINQLVTFPVYKFIDLIQNSGVEYLYFIHDYYCACPSYNLINQEEQYCFNETNIVKCQKCISTNLVTEPWINLDSKSINIETWRNKFRSFLHQAAKVVAPSESTKEIVKTYYPDVEIEVNEHNINTPLKNTFDSSFINEECLNIAFMGAIGESKGSNIIYELKEKIKRNNLPINLKVIGVTNIHQDKFIDDEGKFEVTGKYQNDNISDLLAKNKVSVVVIPALWPETFSYTTSEAMLSGYPVITFNIGAPAERVKRYDAGWIVNETNSDAILKLIVSLDNNRDQIRIKAQHLKDLRDANILLFKQ